MQRRRWPVMRMILERRSVSEELLHRYEHVSRRLRQASAFSDELRLTALKMQEEVEALHEECAKALSSVSGADAGQASEPSKAREGLSDVLRRS